MKTLNLTTQMLLFVALMVYGVFAHAQTGPAMDQINMMGYLKTQAGTPVTDGSGPYTLGFGVFQGGQPIWGTTASVSTSSGLFNFTLTGDGQNLAAGAHACPLCTGFNNNYGAALMNSALFSTASSGSGGEITVRIVVISPQIDGANPYYDVSISTVPTALVADVANTANSVAAGSLTTAAFAAGVVATTSTANAIVQAKGTGLIDTTFIPPITAAMAPTLATSGANTSITGLNPTGALAIGGAGTTGITIAPSSGAANITLTPGGAGNVTVGGAGNGTDTFGNTGGASTTIVTANIVDIGNASTSTVNINPSAGGNGSISIVSSGAGTLTVGGAGTGNSIFGNTGTASTTTLQSGTGALGRTIIESTNDVAVQATGITVPLTSFAIQQGANGTGTLTIASNNTGSTAIASGSGGITVDPGSGNTVTVGDTGAGATTTIQSGTGGINLTGNVAVPTADTLTVSNVTSGAGVPLALAAVAGQNTVLTNSGGALTEIKGGNGIQLDNTGDTFNVAINASGATSSYTLELPVGQGASGQMLTSSGGIGAMTWNYPTPFTTLGDIVYAGATNATGGNPTRLAIGTTGQILTVVAGIPTWTDSVGGAGTTSMSFGGGGGSTTTIASGSGGILVDPGSGNPVTLGDAAGVATTTIQSGTGGIAVSPGVVATGSGTGSSVAISGGVESGVTSTGGSVSINGGSGTSTNGSVNVGTATTAAVSVGSTTATTATLGAISTTIGNTATTTLNVGGTATGTETTTLGSAASASVTTVQSGSGGLKLAPASGNVTVGNSGTGSNLVLNSSSTGAVTLSSGATTTGNSYTITLPTSVGASGQVLGATNGTGTLGWTSVSNPSNSQVNVFEDFLNTVPVAAAAQGVVGRAVYTSKAVATGAYLASTTGNGVYRMALGTAATDASGIGFCGQLAVGTFNPTDFFAVNDTWTFETRLDFNAANSAGENIYIGLIAGAPTEVATSNLLTPLADAGVYWWLQPSSSVMQAITSNGGVVTVGVPTANVDTGANTWDTWTISYSAGTATFSKNHTVITTIATNIPTGTSLCPAVFSQVGAAAAALNLDIDYLSWSHTLNTAR